MEEDVVAWVMKRKCMIETVGNWSSNFLCHRESKKTYLKWIMMIMRFYFSASDTSYTIYVRIRLKIFNKIVEYHCSLATKRTCENKSWCKS